MDNVHHDETPFNVDSLFRVVCLFLLYYFDNRLAIEKQKATLHMPPSAFAHHQMLLRQVVLLTLVVTLSLPHFVLSFSSPRRPVRSVVISRCEPPPPLFVPYSCSTRTFIRRKAAAGAPFIISSSSTLLNAAGSGRGFQQQQGVTTKKKAVLLSDKDYHDQEASLPLSKTTKTNSNSCNSSNIYSKPALYDLAFGFRDYHAQVDFLLAQHAKYSTITKKNNDIEQDDARGISVLFLGAGPARHAFIALNHRHDQNDDRQNNHHHHHHPRVASVTCIDNCSDMVQYGKELAADELQQIEQESAAATSFRYLLADMRNFRSVLVHEEADNVQDNIHNNKSNVLSSSSSSLSLFDTAWILMGSLQHLTTNTDVLQCFHQVAHSLHQGGTFILELPHPKEELLGGMVDCTRNSWHVPLQENAGDDDGYAGQLDIIWGDDNDEFDPISQVRKLTVSLELKEPIATTMTTPGQKTTGKNNKKKSSLSTSSTARVVQSVRQVIPIRLFTAQEIDALATCAGFQVVAMAGALEQQQEEDNDRILSVHDDAAYRLVCILRKL